MSGMNAIINAKEQQQLLTGQDVYNRVNEVVSHITEIRSSVENLAIRFFGIRKSGERVHNGAPDGDSWMHLINREIIDARNVMGDITDTLEEICKISSLNEIRDISEKKLPTNA